MSVTRRSFLAGAAVAAAGAAPSDRVRVAIIGMGGRGRDHMHLLGKTPGVEVAAFCDPDRTRLEEKAAEFVSRGGRKPRLEQDLRRILEDRGIDAVTVATCNHWHALATIWACQAGKHVYVEKPVCHDPFEGAQMIAASRRYDRLVQGGTQRRSNGFARRAIQALHEGAIGDVYMARCIHYQRRDALPFVTPQDPPATLDWNLWLGPGPMQQFNRNLVHYNWHWFWDYGNGELGNNGIHFIDLARWGLQQELPVSVCSSGGRFGYRDPAQTPNTQLTTYRFASGTELVAEIRGRFSNTEANLRSGVAFYGSKGYMISDPKRDGAFLVYLDGKSTPEADLGSLDEREDQLAHFQNFFDAIREGKRELLRAEINETYLSTMYCLLGNIAYRAGHEIRFDPAARQIVNDPQAAAMLRGKYRAPFSVPDRV